MQTKTETTNSIESQTVLHKANLALCRVSAVVDRLSIGLSLLLTFTRRTPTRIASGLPTFSDADDWAVTLGHSADVRLDAHFASLIVGSSVRLALLI